jgi:DNA invertase Pin-like site-specific DNA recombinase
MEAPTSHDGTRARRAIGIVRVSQTAGRNGERFVSPEEQRDRIQAVCERDGLELLAVHDELDVSGGKPLDQRPGLTTAVAAIENGQADVVVAAYFDRLFRSLSMQAKVVERVEQAGGQVLAVDIGQVTHATAGQWLSGTMMGAVSEYFHRSAKERSAEGQARAVARGATPWARIPIGYRRRDDGTLAPDPKTVPLAQRAFEMRAEGKSITQIRNMLREHGVERSHRGVQVMLSSRVYLGEIRFGKLHNVQAHEPIIDRDLWQRVQRMTIPRGHKPKSERLLARLGVLRCGSCGARLSSMKLPKQGDYPIYRCPSTSDCPHHITISAEIAERVVSDAVRQALADAEGKASVADTVRRAQQELDQAQADLDAALRSFAAAGLADEPAAVERLAELRQVRDDVQTQLDRMGPAATTLTVTVDADWERLSVDEQRALIRATVESAIVAPAGRGGSRRDRDRRAAERISVRLRGE